MLLIKMFSFPRSLESDSKTKIMFFLIVAILLNAAYGHPQLDGRIIGGVPAEISEFPYQVSLQTAKGHICGGSIIHADYILTAAHCIEKLTARQLLIRAGSKTVDRGGLNRTVCLIIAHASYDDNTVDFDIAILKLCESLTFSANVLPIALPDFNEPLKAGSPAVVTGWGYTQESGPLSRILQRLTVGIISQNACRQFYQNDGPITSRMMCAGFRKGQRDSCQGDSGGPLLANGKLVGIVSWGNGCARPNFPGVYTRVAKLRKWIKNRINY